MSTNPKLDRLKSQLLTSGLSGKDQPLYQVINTLIDTTRDIEESVNTVLASLGAGKVNGPALSSDKAIARWDGITGKLLQNSLIFVNDAGILQFGGITNTFPAIKPSGILLQSKLADDSAFAGLEILSLNITADADVGFVKFGINPATSGNIRLPANSVGIQARNVANTGNIGIFTSDGADNVIVGFNNTITVIFKPNGVSSVIIDQFGVQAASSSAIYWTGKAVLLSPSDGHIKFSNNGQSTGFTIQANAFADTLLVANFADNAYGKVAALSFQLSAASIISGATDGNIILSNAAITGFSLLQFGGTSSSFPALKRSSAELQFRLADDSAFAVAHCLDIITEDATFFHRSGTALTNNAGAAAGTLLNAPSAGNPTKWIGIDDNGTTRFIPAW